MIVGWQIAAQMRTELVLDALEMAAGLRRPAGDLVAHTDRGSQLTHRPADHHPARRRRLAATS
jgi:transposase InsO family protein